MAKYFYCYSSRLQRAFYANGFKPICTGINTKSGSTFWLYESSDELNAYKNNVYPLERDKYKF